MSNVFRRIVLALRPWIWFLYPGIPLHEYTHAWFGRWLGADAEVRWSEDRPFAVMRWPERPPMEVEVVVHLAPTLLGTMLIGVALNEAWAFAGFSWPVLAYIAINALAYAYPSGTDMVPLKRYLTA